MSKNEDDLNQVYIEENVIDSRPVRERKGQNIRGIAKKREVARENLAKARAIRLQKVKERREQEANNYNIREEDPDDESSSEDEIVLTKAKHKPEPRKGVRDDYGERFDTIEKALLQLAQQTKKQRKTVRKVATRRIAQPVPQIVNVMPAQNIPQHQPTPIENKTPAPVKTFDLFEQMRLIHRPI